MVAVSRNTLGYWADRAPRNPLFLVPNALEPHWINRGARPGSAVQSTRSERPIDVLVQLRKSSPYVLNQLVPALQAQGLRVEVQSGWVDDLVELFNCSKVYLYDSAEYWRGRGVSGVLAFRPWRRWPVAAWCSAALITLWRTSSPPGSRPIKSVRAR